MSIALDMVHETVDKMNKEVQKGLVAKNMEHMESFEHNNHERGYRTATETIQSIVEKVTDLRKPVLIIGATGSGKSTLAQAFKGHPNIKVHDEVITVKGYYDELKDGLVPLEVMTYYIQRKDENVALVDYGTNKELVKLFKDTYKNYTIVETKKDINGDRTIITTHV